MSPNLCPATRNGKSRLMEVRNSYGPSTNPIVHPAVDLQTVLGNTPLPEQGISVHTPEVVSDPRVALFKQLVLSIRKSYAMKKQLNAHHQCHRIDLDKIEVVSDDKAEDPMPDVMDFLSLPCSSATTPGHGPSSSMAHPN